MNLIWLRFAWNAKPAAFLFPFAKASLRLRTHSMKVENLGETRKRKRKMRKMSQRDKERKEDIV